MTVLILGLLIFLGAHSVRIVADPWRSAQIACMGEKRWKGLVSLVSLAGFALIVWGYGQTRGDAALWNPPVWLNHLASLLTVPAFVLLVAAYVPGNRIKTAVGHPMVAAVKLWAFAHLICNSRPGDLLLFGTFLAWAIVDFVSARRRDRAAGTRYPAGPGWHDALVVGIGLVAWVAFAMWGHSWLIGVAPFA